MLGLAYLRADTCSGCGKSLTDTTTTDARDWTATKHVCGACEKLSIDQKALDAKDHPHTSAYVWTVERG